MISFPETLRFPHSQSYQLKAVVSHYGHSVSFGHYKAFVHRDSGWVECDDSTVRPVLFDNVHVSHQCSRYGPLLTSVQDKRAYALFYHIMEETCPAVSNSKKEALSDAHDDKQPFALFNDEILPNITANLKEELSDPNDKQPSAPPSDEILQNVIDDSKEKEELSDLSDENDATKWKTAFNKLTLAFNELTLGFARYDWQIEQAYEVKKNQLTTKLASETLSQEERTAVEGRLNELLEERKSCQSRIDDTEACLRKILPDDEVNSWSELFDSVSPDAPEVGTKLDASAGTDDNTGSA